MKRLPQIMILTFILILASCQDNDASLDPLPEFGSISGEINFIGVWPDSGEVLLTLDTNYPPMGPPAGFVYVTIDSLESNLYNYNFNELSFRDYVALTVTYWPDGYGIGGLGNNSMLGSYIDTISVAQNDADITIDIEATFN